MAYLVEFAARAARDLESLYKEKNAAESEAAARWYNGLEKAIYTLVEYPDRCPVTREDRKLRHLLYSDKPDVYRVIFRVLKKRNTVQLLHIRHGARQAWKPSALR